MKIIISHDVDHLFLKEHLKDTFLLGNFYRSLKNLAQGNITFKAFLKRFSRELNRIRSLHEFNKANGVKETFFFGMRKGLNLSYNWQDTKPFIEYLIREEVLVGIHGMGYNSFDLLNEESNRLKTLLPLSYPLGIRTHYLRMDDNTLSIMEKIGFLYDSTQYILKNPFLHGKMWEIPINIMDAGFISSYRISLEELKKKTINKIQEAQSRSLPFFVINFHDIYYSDSYPLHKAWYEWLVSYFKNAGNQFVNFAEAIDLLNKPL